MGTTGWTVKVIDNVTGAAEVLVNADAHGIDLRFLDVNDAPIQKFVSVARDLRGLVREEEP